jgi:hypothetical protein
MVATRSVEIILEQSQEVTVPSEEGTLFSCEHSEPAVEGGVCKTVIALLTIKWALPVWLMCTAW